MSVLVTGGAGFIGSHLCRTLLEKGYQVICVDNFFTGNIENIKVLEKDSNFKLIPYDITNTLTGIVTEHVDEIYNLACPASPIHYQFDPIETVKANTIGIINVLEFAKLNGAKIFQASTSEVYGDPLEHPQSEKYRGNVNTLGPRACYDEGKRIAETLFMNYHRRYGLGIRIARIFNTYGPNMAQDDGRVVSNFITQALRDENLTVYGGGEQTRCFCYVDDMVEGIYRMMNSNFKGPINLGNPQEITILELTNKILEIITESRSKIVFNELPEDDPMKRRPDISLAKANLGWEPKIKLKDGLERTIQYFRGMI
ncbi:UDP-glucuronate decarboxylase [Candidatus Methanophagaceae archaeon]|nr:UDP-glucuronate decarboxylase [Methanophagales archaeon]